MDNAALGKILVSHLGDAVFLSTLSADGVYGNFVAVNDSACVRLGYRREELLNMNARSLNPSANLERVRAFGRNIRRDGVMIMEAIHVAKDGTQIPVEVTASLISVDGQEYVLSVAKDLRQSQKIKKSEVLFARLMDHSWDEIYVFDSESLCILQANQGALDNLGYSTQEIKRATIIDIQAELTAESLRNASAPLFAGSVARVILETSHRRKNGSTYPVEMRLQLSHSEVPPVFLAIAQDISQRKETESRLNYLANYDSLTGLPNRSSFMESLNYSMALCARTDTLSGLIFIDLDGFKFVNDTHGHNVGDKLLIEVGQRLRKTLRKTDFVSRLGGDEFTAIVTNVRNVTGLETVASNLLRNLSQPYQVDGIQLSVTPSIGVSIYPFSDVDDAYGLIKKADTAMYQAKNQGKNSFQFYTAAYAADQYRRNLLEEALKHAVRQGELSIHYQPRIDLRSMRMVGAEALLRWTHSELGPVTPDEFIPIMESTGGIVAAGEWLIRESFSQLKEWIAIDPAFRLSVNASGRQFEKGNLIAVIREGMDSVGVQSHNIEVEITEGALISRTDQAMAILNSLREMGISIALDDFGSGYSSLNYLRKFPITVLKIDRTFVAELGRNRENTVITDTMITLAHNLNLRITAEGIETPEQLEFLQSRNCEEGQGYLFERPVAAVDITRLLQSAARD